MPVRCGFGLEFLDGGQPVESSLFILGEQMVGQVGLKVATGWFVKRE